MTPTRASRTSSAAETTSQTPRDKCSFPARTRFPDTALRTFAAHHGQQRTKSWANATAQRLSLTYRDEGILPEAMLNYLTFLGWNPGDEREYLSREELMQAFDLARVQKGSAIFDEVKLFSVNQYWMRKLSVDEFIARAILETRYANAS
jgi:hypothetical protein